MKTALIFSYLVFFLSVISNASIVCAQPQSTFATPTTQMQTIQPSQQVQINQETQSVQPSLPELPQTPRSELEIIQYILLPFAIGAAIWLIIRLEKVEQEEKKENKQE
ncbi:MAG TPA: hypothetical protein ACFYD7_04320 [Candidatus Wujingus californicus]|uniref:hypothetical protein n=1 Tax=Candidatus Wujingus californicus TaxID=3367618 RepID=UPI001D7561D1|nr:hypothetical protein [Planctomycetota bacterium]